MTLSVTHSRTPLDPSINPLIKVMNLVALLIAPAVVTMFLNDQTGMRLGIACCGYRDYRCGRRHQQPSPDRRWGGRIDENLKGSDNPSPTSDEADAPAGSDGAGDDSKEESAPVS